MCRFCHSQKTQPTLSHVIWCDPVTIDKTLLEKNFSKAAKSYEQSAVVQRNVLHDLVDNLSYLNITPKRILDLGAGTGLGGRMLRKLFPKAEIILFDISLAMLRQTKKHQTFFSKNPCLVCGDIDRLPFLDRRFDLIFSSLSLHWCHDQLTAFRTIHQCLSEGGLFVFSGLGPETVKEFRLSWQAVDPFQHVNEFNDIQWYGNSLIQAGFNDPVVTREIIQETFQTGMDAVQALRKIGVVNVNDERNKHLVSKTKFKSFLSAYESFRTNGVLPLSYEVFYGTAWAASASSASQSEVHVSVPSVNSRR